MIVILNDINGKYSAGETVDRREEEAMNNGDNANVTPAAAASAIVQEQET